MNLRLPPLALRKLEQTLAQWQQWRSADELPGAPHVLRPLGGVSNYNVLAEAAGQQFAIRLDRVNPAANGLNRQVEWRALEAGHKAGIAPRPRYFNPELGVLVCDYLPPDEQQAPEIAELADLIRRIHQLPPLHFRLELSERIRRYQRQLPKQDTSTGQVLEEIDQALAPQLKAFSGSRQPSFLCHNDLNADNLLISQGELFALDWEYCAMGNPWLDLATACAAQVYDLQQRDQLLEQYLQRAVADGDRLQLLRADCIVSYLEVLWYLSQRPDHHSEATIGTHIEQLQSKLLQLSRGNY